MITTLTQTSHALGRARVVVGAYDGSRLDAPWSPTNISAQGTNGFPAMGTGVDRNECIKHDATATRLLRTRST